MVAERDVGIEVFSTATAPVSAIMRHRYTDFRVNEISEDMHVAKYVDDTLPVVKAKPAGTFEDQENVQRMLTEFEALVGAEKAETLNGFISNLQARVSPCHQAPHRSRLRKPISTRQHTTDPGAHAASRSPTYGSAANVGHACAPRLQEKEPEGPAQGAPEGGVPGPSAPAEEPGPSAAAPPQVLFSGISDKVQRTALHQFFKQDFRLPTLVTDTVTVDGENHIRLMTQRDLRRSVQQPCEPPAALKSIPQAADRLRHRMGSVQAAGAVQRWEGGARPRSGPRPRRP